MSTPALPHVKVHSKHYPDWRNPGSLLRAQAFYQMIDVLSLFLREAYSLYPVLSMTYHALHR